VSSATSINNPSPPSSSKSFITSPPSVNRLSPPSSSSIIMCVTETENDHNNSFYSFCSTSTY
jgi:hypothetical protein